MKSFRSLALLLCVWCVWPCLVPAQEWIDVTSHYLQNAAFDKNQSAGWQSTLSGGKREARQAAYHFQGCSFNYGSWVELYNPTDRSVSINGFYVSDDPAVCIVLWV